MEQFIFLITYYFRTTVIPLAANQCNAILKLDIYCSSVSLNTLH